MVCPCTKAHRPNFSAWSQRGRRVNTQMYIAFDFLLTQTVKYVMLYHKLWPTTRDQKRARE